MKHLIIILATLLFTTSAYADCRNYAMEKAHIKLNRTGDYCIRKDGVVVHLDTYKRTAYIKKHQDKYKKKKETKSNVKNKHSNTRTINRTKHTSKKSNKRSMATGKRKR